mgnify:CR=1 FL=1
MILINNVESLDFVDGLFNLAPIKELYPTLKVNIDQKGEEIIFRSTATYNGGSLSSNVVYPIDSFIKSCYSIEFFNHIIEDIIWKSFTPTRREDELFIEFKDSDEDYYDASKVNKGVIRKKATSSQISEKLKSNIEILEMNAIFDDAVFLLIFKKAKKKMKK